MEKIFSKVSNSSNCEKAIAVGSLFGAIILFKSIIRLKSRKRFKRSSPTSDGRLKSILVTGGASGIGLRTTVKFLLEGWNVGVYDINIEGLEKKICEIEPLLEKVLEDRLCFGTLDVTEEESCRKAIENFTLFTNGYLDALFNCAGLLYVGSFEKGSVKRQCNMIKVNCEGLMQMTHVSLDALKKTKDSCIISMASLSAVGSLPNHAVYCSTKAFVWSLTGALRSELTVAFGIRVCDVSVSFVNTPMVQAQDKSNYTGIFKKQLEDVSPEEVAETVFYAVHTCDRQNTHYFVRSVDWLSFKVSRVLETFCPRLFTFIYETISLLEYQTKKQY